MGRPARRAPGTRWPPPTWCAHSAEPTSRPGCPPTRASPPTGAWRPSARRTRPSTSDASRTSRGVLERLRVSRFVAVVGPSGSGKSSLVQAGLLPALRRDGSPAAGWRVLDVVPGARPLAALAAQLRPPAGRGRPLPRRPRRGRAHPRPGDGPRARGPAGGRPRAAGRRPAGGGVHALPGRRASGRRSSATSSTRPRSPAAGPSWSRRCAPTSTTASRSTPPLRGLVGVAAGAPRPPGRARPAPRHRGAGPPLRPGAGAGAHPPDPHRRRRPAGDPPPDGAPAAGALAAPPRPHADPRGVRRLGRRRGRPGPPGERRSTAR